MQRGRRLHPVRVLQGFKRPVQILDAQSLSNSLMLPTLPRAAGLVRRIFLNLSLDVSIIFSSAS